MADNPFDHLSAQIAVLSAKVDHLIKAVDRPKAEWEMMHTAMARRKKSRKAILDLVNAGKIQCRRVRVPGGKEAYHLWVPDLDKVIPITE